MIRFRGGSTVIFLLVALVSPYAQSPRTTVESSLDWSNSTLSLTIGADRERDGRNSAAASLDAQRRLEDLFLDQLLERLYQVPVDSRRTVGEVIEQEPWIAADVVDLALDAQRSVPYASADLSRLYRRFSVRIFPDFADIFVQHEVPFRIEEVVQWIPTREYTGLVIYAAEPLPVRGETTADGNPVVRYVVPALFPEIYDENFRPVLQQDMLYPDWIRRWGVVEYTELVDADWADRVGQNPMRITARQAFGVRPSNIVIDPLDADRLLATATNREILKQGRIVVILAPGRSSD